MSDKARTRVEVNPRLQEQLNGTPAMQKALLRLARRAEKEAVKIAREFENTGAYRRSIRSRIDGDQVVLESTDPFAHLVEFGSINNEAYAPLRRAAENVGRLRENPK